MVNHCAGSGAQVGVQGIEMSSDWSQATDAELVAGVREHDRGALRELFVHIDWEHDGLRLAMGTEEHRLAVALAESLEQAGQPFAGLAD